MKAFKSLFAVAKKRILTFSIGFVFAILCFLGLNLAMEPVSTSEYCGGKCHEMNTAYQSWELSTHGSNKFGYRVECVDCHLPPKKDYFTHMAAKAYEGGKDIYKHYFGDEYNIEKIRKKVLYNISNQRCDGCHDDLLARPSGQAARTAHLAVVTEPDKPENRCVECHENVGHERQKKLFTP